MTEGKGRILGPEQIRQLLAHVARTLPKELTCDECLEELDRFAEMTLAGRPAEEALPLVAQHLAICRDCREEFEALLRALQVFLEGENEAAP